MPLFLITGKPPPQIIWFKDETNLKSEVNYIPAERYVKSEITIGPLRRTDLNSRITCRANNHPRAPSVESVVQIDMNCMYKIISF